MAVDCSKVRNALKDFSQACHSLRNDGKSLLGRAASGATGVVVTGVTGAVNYGRRFMYSQDHEKSTLCIWINWMGQR